MGTTLEEQITSISRLVSSPVDQELISATIKALDNRYALAWKIEQEPGLKGIIQELIGRIYLAYGTFSRVRGQRILDIACGSNTSKYPSRESEGYTALFEPWFCRILLELGAEPVGLDMGDLEQETFEHYHVDLGQPDALNILQERSFDAIQDSRLFGSPEFTAQFPNLADRVSVAARIWQQEQRLLKPGGVIIHSDAAELIGKP